MTFARRGRPEPDLPQDEFARAAKFPKPQFRERAEPADTRDLKFRKIHPLRDPGFLRNLTFQVCVIFGKTNARTGVVHVCWHPDVLPGGRYKSDPMHTGKAYSGKLKRTDRGAMPGCRHAHREQEANMDRFDSDYGIDRHAIAEEHFVRYLEEQERGR